MVDNAKHTCLRRMSDWGPWERTENLDEYTAGHGLVGQPRGCSFCGSLPPDDFMAAVKAGAEIGPTDKSYKLYVKWENPEPERLHPISASRTDRPPLGGLNLIPWDEMSGEQRAEALDVFGQDAAEVYPYIGFGTRPSVDAKFYTAHLSPGQGREFYEIWQAGRVNWGYPGAPYRPLYLPGFEKRTEGGDADHHRRG